MKISKTLNVSQKEFYEYLILSLMIDIHKNSDQLILENQLRKGFCYQKKLKSSILSNVEIIELTKPFVYHMQITVGSNIHEIKYELEKLNDQQVTVAYCENYRSDKKLNQWNYTIMKFITKHKNVRLMMKMLENMEMHILNKTEHERSE